MNELNIYSNLMSNITAIPNVFIDTYMSNANGEYVKIYLYLLRHLNNKSSLSVSKIADFFDHTERDIIKALNYWEKVNLIKLDYDCDSNLTAVTLLEFMPQITKEEPKVLDEPKKFTPVANPIISEKPTYSQSQIKKITTNDEMQQLLYIAQKYLGRTLSSTDLNTLIYFYEALSLSTDLIMYLLEYCVSKNQKSMRYIEKVALSWVNDGITTVEKAKENTSLFSSNYFSVMKAFGINDRNPVESEMNFIKKWLEVYQFDINIILEACNRTMNQIHKPSFNYADTMLSKWHSHRVRHLSDISNIDKAHNQSKDKKDTPKNSLVKPLPKGSFPQREYETNDYMDMEKKFLNYKGSD